jgi:hypothetical protein
MKGRVPHPVSLTSRQALLESEFYPVPPIILSLLSHELIDGVDPIFPRTETVRFVSPDYSFGAFHVSARSSNS